MGFLRKVGRKIKKGVKKLFSTKFGALIGGIGLSLILGPAISQAFNGIKGFFTQGATTAGATNVAVVDSTVSGAVEKLVNTPDLVVDFGEKIFEGGVGLKGDASLKGDIAAKFAESAAKGPTVGQNIRQNFVNLGKGVKEFTQNPMQKTKEFVGDDFIADTARSTGASLALSAIQGEPEEPFISGGVAPQPDMVASQDAFVREVGTQIPDYQGVNFQNLSNSMLFGTLSPQFLIGQAQSYS